MKHLAFNDLVLCLGDFSEMIISPANREPTSNIKPPGSQGCQTKYTAHVLMFISSKTDLTIQLGRKSDQF